MQLSWRGASSLTTIATVARSIVLLTIALSSRRVNADERPRSLFVISDGHDSRQPAQSVRFVSEDGQFCRVAFQRPSSCLSSRDGPSRKAAHSGVVVLLFDASMFLPGGVQPLTQSIKASARKLLNALDVELPVLAYSADAGIGSVYRIRETRDDAGPVPVVQQTSPSDVEQALSVFDKALVDSHKTVQIHLMGMQRFRLSVVEALANHVAPFTGRKALIWVCGSGTFDRMPSRTGPAHDLWFSAMNAIERVNLSIYSVGCLFGGLNAPTPGAMRPSGLPEIVGSGPSAGTFVQQSRTLVPSDWNGLSRLTGGRFYSGDDQLKRAVTEALRDNQCVEELGWIPPAAENLVEIHTIKLKEESHKLLYRHFHVDPVLPFDLAGRLSEAERMLEIPIKQNGIPLRIDATREAATTSVFTISFDPETVGFTDHGLTDDALLDAIFALYDSAGRRLKQGSRSEIKLRVPVKEWPTFRSKLASIRQAIDLPAEMHSIKVLLRDSTNGNVGTAHLIMP